MVIRKKSELEEELTEEEKLRKIEQKPFEIDISEREKRIAELTRAGQSEKSAKIQANREQREGFISGEEGIKRQQATQALGALSSEQLLTELETSPFATDVVNRPDILSQAEAVPEEERQRRLRQEFGAAGLGATGLAETRTPIQTLTDTVFKKFKPKSDSNLSPDMNQELQRNQITEEINKELFPARLFTNSQNAIASLLGRARVFGFGAGQVVPDLERLNFDERFKRISADVSKNVDLINDMGAFAERNPPQAANALQNLRNYQGELEELEADLVYLASISPSVRASEDFRDADNNLRKARDKLLNSSNIVGNVLIKGELGREPSDVELLAFHEKIKKRRSENDR